MQRPKPQAGSVLLRFIAPSRQLSGPIAERAASTLAGWALVLIALFLSVDVASLLSVPQYQPPWFGYMALLAVYGLARSPYYKFGAFILVGMFPTVALGHVILGQAADPSVTLGYMVLSPLLGASLLSVRSIPILGVLNLSALAGLPWLAPDTVPPNSSLAGIAVAIVMATLLALLWAYNRDWAETERRRMLASEEKRLRLALDGAGLGQWEMQIDTGRSEGSSRSEQILGLAPGQWGRGTDALMRSVHPDDRELVAEALQGVRNGARSVCIEHRVRLPDGTARWVEMRGQELKPGCLTGTVADVTERRELEARLRQAQKLDAIGRLAGGVAHDFNNLLTVVLGNVHLLRERAAGEEVEQIEEAASSAQALTSQLLAFSRQSQMRLEPMELTEVVSTATAMARRIAGEKIVVRYEAPEFTWPTLADPVQVQQAILNLAMNSNDAMPDGGTLSFGLENCQRTDESGQSQDFVRVAISDTGAGIPVSDQELVLDPFFTTKQPGEGNGLGLSMAHSMMKHVGGLLEVDSEPGKGCTITLWFPRAKDSERRRSPVVQGALAGTETVLLVEDETVVRKLCERVLRKAGYVVFAAGSAAEALAQWKVHKNAIDVLLSDVVMPGKSGPELAAVLLAESPHLPVVFMSGYTPEMEVRLEGARTEFLAKPFKSPALLAKVRLLLDESSTDSPSSPNGTVEP